MGGPKVPSTQDTTAGVLQAYQQYLPGLANAAAKSIPKIDQATLKSSQQTSPQYAALQQQLLAQFGPQAGAVGDLINRNSAMSGAQSDLGILNGPGEGIVRQGQDLARIADPEYYKNRELLSGGLEKLIGGQDPNVLTGGELTAATRGLNMIPGGVNPAGNPSMTTAIANAGVYGDALSQKRNQYSQALQTATGAAPALKSGTDTFQQALGRPSTSNVGTGQFSSSPQQNQAGAQFTQSALGGVTGIGAQTQQLAANRQTPLSVTGEAASSY